MIALSVGTGCSVTLTTSSVGSSMLTIAHSTSASASAANLNGSRVVAAEMARRWSVVRGLEVLVTTASAPPAAA